MTQVDFYITDDNQVRAQSLLACRLTEKAYKLGHRIHINVATREQADELDNLLWEFRQGSFIPHQHISANEALTAPVSISAGEQPSQAPDVLVNLAANVPSWFAECARVAEIVDGNHERRQASRSKYKFYRSQGCPLQSHELTR
jgi:DNA polymerase-3 subunit chi